MRREERIKAIELRILELEFEVEVLMTAVQYLLENNESKAPDIDSGKWYRAKPEN